MLVKHGFLPKEMTQRYRCKTCGKTCSEAHRRQFGILRSDPAKIIQTVSMLTEGSGIRSTSRVVGIHRDTVLRILKFAGERAERLLKRRLEGIQSKHMQMDEVWTMIRKRRQPDENDHYTFMAMDSETKLIFAPYLGKRNEPSTNEFVKDLARSIDGRVQITTDGFQPYRQAVCASFKGRTDFAQYYKEYTMLQSQRSNCKTDGLKRAAGPVKKSKAATQRFYVRAGTPDTSRITTSHIERANLTLRLMNKRWNRETMCFSKTEIFAHYSLQLFAAHYDFVKSHASLGNQTPAMAAGLAEGKWDIARLIAFAE